MTARLLLRLRAEAPGHNSVPPRGNTATKTQVCWDLQRYVGWQQAFQQWRRNKRGRLLALIYAQGRRCGSER